MQATDSAADLARNGDPGEIFEELELQPSFEIDQTELRVLVTQVETRDEMANERTLYNLGFRLEKCK